MEISQKIEVLNKLGTKDLIEKIIEQENKLEKLLQEDAVYRKEHVGYLASYSDDCSEVKIQIAELEFEAPPQEDGKKPTVAQTNAWLRQQRTKNPQLAKTIATQHEVNFQVENNRVAIEMAKKRLESLKGLLGLRTAQIEFLREK